MHVYAATYMYVHVLLYRNALRHAFYVLTTGKPEGRVSAFCHMHTMCTCIYFIHSKTFPGKNINKLYTLENYSVAVC